MLKQWSLDLDHSWFVTMQRISIFCVVFFLLLSSWTQTQVIRQGKNFHLLNVLVEDNRKLKVGTSNISQEIPSIKASACMLKCVRDEQCVSVNHKKSSDGMGLCQILTVDKWRARGDYVEDENFQHLYIKVSTIMNGQRNYVETLISGYQIFMVFKLLIIA